MGSSREDFVLTSALLLPSLVLQRPSMRSKVKDHIACLKRRLPLWETNDGINHLLKEGTQIQRQLYRKPRSTPKIFTEFMTKGKIKDAIRTLSETQKGGTLELTDTINTGPENSKSVFEILLEKHPENQPPSPETIVTPPTNPDVSSHVLFQALDSKAVRQAVLNTNGSAGPSGVDSTAWRRWCTCYNQHSVTLCNSLASVGRKLCSKYVDPIGLYAFNACRLVPLDKCPGVRPIGVVEVCRRIIGKALLKIAKWDILESTAGFQFCSGLDGGCEAAVHCMAKISESEEATLFVDATKAFNSLNRASTLIKVQTICPTLAPILINTYRTSGTLFVNGTTIQSREGTTQGDPLGMVMYAIGTLPLIKHLDSSFIHQVWYADDSAAGGDLTHLKKWWDELQCLGPKFGQTAKKQSYS